MPYIDILPRLECGRPLCEGWAILVFTADMATTELKNDDDLRELLCVSWLEDCSVTEQWVLICACTRGSTGTVKEMLGGGGLGASALARLALCVACRHGRLELAKWLVEEFGLGAADARVCDNFALRLSCAGGHLETVRWLVAKFSLSAVDARSRSGSALRLSCANGHSETALWLVDEFDLGADDAREVDNFALRAACRNGHFDLAEWLVVATGLGPADVRSVEDQILCCACERGALEELKWVLDAGEYTPADIRAFRHLYPLYLVCKGGHLAAAEWLTREFGRGLADVLSRVDVVTCGALVAACSGGQLKMAQWLVSEFGLTDAEVRADGLALRAACCVGDNKVAEWLVAAYYPEFASSAGIGPFQGALKLLTFFQYEAARRAGPVARETADGGPSGTQIS